MFSKKKNDSAPSPKREKNLKDAPLPPLPFNRPSSDEGNEDKEIEKLIKKEGALTADEATKLLDDLRHKQDRLRRKLDEMYKERGMSPEYIESYLSNPSNFSAEQWKDLQEQRQTLFETLKLGPDFIGEEAKEAFLHPTGKTAEEERPKERRKKESSAQRRGWLPMR